eukprot:2832482-Prymnesium_polylepis.1
MHARHISKRFAIPAPECRKSFRRGPRAGNPCVQSSRSFTCAAPGAAPSSRRSSTPYRRGAGARKAVCQSARRASQLARYAGLRH